MQREAYFDLLFQCLHEIELLPVETSNHWRMDFQKYFEMAEIDLRIIYRMREQYGVGFENVFLINCRKNVLLCDNFRTCRDKALIRTSVYFTVLGCLLDYLLDHGNHGQKREAGRKLEWDYCKDYFLSRRAAKEHSAIDLLYEKISSGMHVICKYNRAHYENIIGLVKTASAAELKVNGMDRGFFQETAVLSKSVIFVQTAIEILLAKKEKIENADRTLIKELGYLFALMDDLCDLYEDLEIGQMNFLMKYADREIPVKAVVRELAEGLQRLKEHFDRPLYEFILQELREWAMSNSELRKRICGEVF